MNLGIFRFEFFCVYELYSIFLNGITLEHYLVCWSRILRFLITFSCSIFYIFDLNFIIESKLILYYF